MKKILCVLLVLGLVACSEEKPVIIAPESHELGNICTLITEFDEDMYNLSFFYTENEQYPILNKDDFTYINQLGLKHSSSGSKDVNKY